MNRIPRILIAAATAVLLAVSARAQTAEPSPSDTPFRAGPVQLFPSLSMRDIGIDSNVYNESVVLREDFTYTVAPSLKAVLPIGDARLTGNGGLGFVYFRTLKDQQSLNGSVNGQLAVDSGRVRPFATAGYVRSRQRNGYDVDARALSTATQGMAGATVGVSAITSLTGSVMRESTRFAPGEQFLGESLSEQLDRVRTGATGGFRFDVTPLTSIVAVLEVERARFAHNPLRDADSMRLAPVVQFAEGAIIAGQASVGFRDFTPLDPRLARYRGLVASAGVGFTVLGVTKVDAQASRDVSFSYDDAQPLYLGSGGQVTVTQTVIGPLQAIVIGGRQRLLYQTLGSLRFDGRRETVTTKGAGLGIRIDEHMRFALTLEDEERVSSGPALRQYDRRRVFGALSYVP